MDRKEIIERITPKRTMPFFGDVNGDLYCQTRDHLTKMVAESSNPITILIDSVGGDVFSALQVVDFIRMLPVETIGIVLEARSAAVYVLQACSRRMIVPSGRLLIHSVQPTIKGVGTTIRLDGDWEERIQRIVKELTCHRKDTEDLICARSGMSQKKLKELTKKGDDPSLPYFINSKESLELNLVDAIVPTDYKLFVPSEPQQKEEPPSEEKT